MYMHVVFAATLCEKPAYIHLLLHLNLYVVVLMSIRSISAPLLLSESCFRCCTLTAVPCVLFLARSQCHNHLFGVSQAFLSSFQ